MELSVAVFAMSGCVSVDHSIEALIDDESRVKTIPFRSGALAFW